MWLYVPAVRQGRTKKLASFWRGPYTVIDRLNAALNYRIQLVGSTKTLVVHRNRLKRCYGIPREKEKEGQMVRHTSLQQDGILEAAQAMDPVPEDDTEDGTEIQEGGYVEADNDEGMEEIQPLRPQRIRRPPDRHGIYVEH